MKRTSFNFTSAGQREQRLSIFAFPTLPKSPNAGTAENRARQEPSARNQSKRLGLGFASLMLLFATIALLVLIVRAEKRFPPPLAALGGFGDFGGVPNLNGISMLFIRISSPNNLRGALQTLPGRLGLIYGPGNCQSSHMALLAKQLANSRVENIYLALSDLSQSRACAHLLMVALDQLGSGTTVGVAG